MRVRPYNLLIATGRSPQVITETVFELNRPEGGPQPAAVHVVTTRMGRAYGKAQLLGEPHEDPSRGVPIEGVENRWQSFCEDELGRTSSGDDPPVEISFHVPEGIDGRLEDIRQQGEDTRFANLCYELVEQLTREDAIPLIGSIAGGRKTMSAHLMTAFCVHGRPDDRLTHVLLSDPSLEGDRSFFYPERGSPRYGQLLNLVEVRYPKLRTVLSDELLASRDLEGILDYLEPHVASARTIETVEVQLRDGEAQLVFKDTDGPVDTCSLTSKHAATLLAFAEQRAGQDGPVPSTALTYETEDTRIGRQREAVRYLCSRGDSDPLAPWSETEAVSKDISSFKDELRQVPVADRLLRIEGISKDPTYYDWPGELPPLQVTTRYTGQDWPFEHLPGLERPE